MNGHGRTHPPARSIVSQHQRPGRRGGTALMEGRFMTPYGARIARRGVFTGSGSGRRCLVCHHPSELDEVEAVGRAAFFENRAAFFEKLMSTRTGPSTPQPCEGRHRGPWIDLAGADPRRALRLVPGARPRHRQPPGPAEGESERAAGAPHAGARGVLPRALIRSSTRKLTQDVRRGEGALRLGRK